MNPDELIVRYAALKQARQNLYDDTETVIKASKALKEQEAAVLLSGKCDGKNAEVRAAQLADAVALEKGALERAEARKRWAAVALEIAADDLRLARDLIRLEEIGLKGMI